jgi:hypothetical protein
MIAIIREQLAEPGVTVTESKKLYDQASDTMREVDVVAEGTVDGDAITVSVEVIDHERPASLTWVDQMLGKHMHMPTNRLVLVSWSGFSRAALRKAGAMPTVEAITPTPVFDPDGRPRHAEPLYLERTTLVTERVAVAVCLPDGASQTVLVYRNSATYDKDGAEQEPVGEIVTALLRSDAIGRRVCSDAHARENRGNLRKFVIGLRNLDQHLQRYVTFAESPNDLHLITAMQIDGRFAWEQTELKFAVVNVAGRAHGIAQAPWFGRDAIWVATPKNDGTDEVQVTWRTMVTQEPTAGLESSWSRVTTQEAATPDQPGRSTSSSRRSHHPGERADPLPHGRPPNPVS